MQKRHFELKHDTLFVYNNSSKTKDKHSNIIFMPGLHIQYLGYCSMTNKYALEIGGFSSAESQLSKKLYHKSKKVILAWVQNLKNSAGDLDFSTYYTLGKQIAQGKYATIHQCQNILTGHVDAVKIINKMTLNKLQLEFVSQEIQIAKTLSHSKIVNFKRVFESESHIHIVMELVKGTELTHYMNMRQLSKSQTISVTTQILEALTYLKECGIVHRDIKPSNILIEQDWTNSSNLKVKLIDFGISKILLPSEKSFDRCGTFQYIAPEILQN